MWPTRSLKYLTPIVEQVSECTFNRMNLCTWVLAVFCEKSAAMIVYVYQLTIPLPKLATYELFESILEFNLLSMKSLCTPK